MNERDLIRREGKINGAGCGDFVPLLRLLDLNIFFKLRKVHQWDFNFAWSYPVFLEALFIYWTVGHSAPCGRIRMGSKTQFKNSSYVSAYHNQLFKARPNIKNVFIASGRSPDFRFTEFSWLKEIHFLRSSHWKSTHVPGIPSCHIDELRRIITVKQRAKSDRSLDAW